MRLTILLRVVVVGLLFGLVAFATPAQDQSSDDVAAAAKRTREQQKNTEKPKKVLTNDDFPSGKATPPTDATAAKPGGEQASTADDTNADKDPNGEAAWRKRFKTIRDKIAAAEKELDILQRELDKGEVQYYSDPQKAMQEQHDRSDINDKRAKIDAKKKDIDNLNQQLTDLEDQLRKSGGDPGWAR